MDFVCGFCYLEKLLLLLIKYLYFHDKSYTAWSRSAVRENR